MNPLTNVRNIVNLNKRELELGIPYSKSWHQQYRSSAWVFLGGLDYDLTEGDIICLFSQYGEVVNINLVRDKKSGKSKGFAFLCYENQISTVLAVDNLNSIKLCGRTIRVDHVEEYKVPKMREDMEPEQQRLALQGCAPVVQQGPGQAAGNSAAEGQQRWGGDVEEHQRRDSGAADGQLDVKTEHFNDVDMPPRLFVPIKGDLEKESKNKNEHKKKSKKSKKKDKKLKKKKHHRPSASSSLSEISSDSDELSRHGRQHNDVGVKRQRHYDDVAVKRQRVGRQEASLVDDDKFGGGSGDGISSGRGDEDERTHSRNKTNYKVDSTDAEKTRNYEDGRKYHIENNDRQKRDSRESSENKYRKVKYQRDEKHYHYGDERKRSYNSDDDGEIKRRKNECSMGHREHKNISDFKGSRR